MRRILMRKQVISLTLTQLLYLLLSAESSYSASKSACMRIDEFRRIKKVLVKVEEDYGDAINVDLPFERITRKALRIAGVTTAKTNDADYDAVLLIKVKGKPIGAYYEVSTSNIPKNQKKVNCYTGASISGTISVEIPHIDPLKESFKGHILPARSIEYFCPTPSSAPFDLAFGTSGSFEDKIVQVLGKMFGIDFLLATLEDRRLDTNAREAIIRLGDKSVRSLTLALRNGNTNVRSNAAKALIGIRGDQALEPLVDALQDENWSVRSSAAEALGELKHEGAVKHLVSALGDESLSVRLMAVIALGNIKDSRAIGPLIALLKDEDENLCKNAGRKMCADVCLWVRMSVADALAEITGEDFGQNASKWREWFKEEKF